MTSMSSNLISSKTSSPIAFGQHAFGNDLCQLVFQQFFKLFAQFKTTTKYENHVFLYPFSNMAISPKTNEKTILYW